jgi:hypothetical protein
MQVLGAGAVHGPAHWHLVLDQVIASLPAWQRGLLARSGRLILIKSVVTARPIHQLLVKEAPVWLLDEIDKWTRAFFWAGKEGCQWGVMSCVLAADLQAGVVRWPGCPQS